VIVSSPVKKREKKNRASGPVQVDMLNQQINSAKPKCQDKLPKEKI